MPKTPSKTFSPLASFIICVENRCQRKGGLSGFVKENADRIFTFLSHVDLTGCAPEKDMPQTEYVKEIQAAFRNPIYLFWDDSEWCKHDFDKIPTNSEKIFEQYVGWCEKMKVKNAPAFPRFGRLARNGVHCDSGDAIRRKGAMDHWQHIGRCCQKPGSETFFRDW